MSDRVSVSPITDDMARKIVQAIADPGHFLKRGDDYTEPIPSWSGRAVVQVLNEWLAAVSVGCAATTGTPVGITDDIVERAAKEIDPGGIFASTPQVARKILEAALAGYTPVRLPERDPLGTFSGESACARAEIVGGLPAVRIKIGDGDDSVIPVDTFEGVVGPGLAAAREARRMAGSVSLKGDDTK